MTGQPYQRPGGHPGQHQREHRGGQRRPAGVVRVGGHHVDHRHRGGGPDEIIAAIATEAVAEVAGALDSAFDAADPPPLDEVLGAAFVAIRRVDAEHGMAKLALQVWGEAVRSPALAGILTGEIARVRDSLARLVGSYQDRGLMAADAPPEHVARVLIGLLPGFVFRHALLGDVDPAAFRCGLRTLLTTRLESPLPSATTA